MADHIKIRKAAGRWTVRSGGAVLGESSTALELSEGDYAPVIYFPRADIAMAMLDPSDKRSRCEHKGEASYFTIVNRSARVENAVWSYEDPLEAMAKIKGYLAFAVGDEVTVEQV
ncbi:MAG: DUF427 domain-containing protein [Sedimentitalea sp.]